MVLLSENIQSNFFFSGGEHFHAPSRRRDNDSKSVSQTKTLTYTNESWNRGDDVRRC